MLGAEAKESATSTVIDFLEKAGLDVGDIVEDNDDDENDDNVIETECGVDLSCPQDEEVLEERPEGGRKWFILLAAFFILPVVFAYNTLLSQVIVALEVEFYQSLRDSKEICTGDYLDYGYDTYYYCVTLGDGAGEVDDIKNIQDVHDKTYNLVGIITGILIVGIDYRLVAVTGAVVNIFVLLISAFITNYKALVFLLGFCVAVGNNMLYLSSLVALLEYFRLKRNLAIAVSDILSILGIIGALVMERFLFPKLDLTSARGILLYTCISYVLCLAAGATLKPLNHQMKEGGQSFRGRVLDVEGLQILKAPLLYMIMCIFLCYNYGQSVPQAKLQALTGVDKPDEGWLNNLLLYIGKFLGSVLVGLFSSTCCCKLIQCCMCCCRLINCCLCCSKVFGCQECCLTRMTVTKAAILLTLTLAMIGGFQLSIEALTSSDLIPVYSLVFGILAGIIDPATKPLVPLALGEKFLGVTMGLADFAAGLGVILSEEFSDLAEKNTGRVAPCFHIGSGFLLLGSMSAAVLGVYFVKVHNKTSNLHEEDGSSVVAPENSQDAVDGNSEMKNSKANRSTFNPDLDENEGMSENNDDQRSEVNDNNKTPKDGAAKSNRDDHLAIISDGGVKFTGYHRRMDDDEFQKVAVDSVD